MTRRRRLRPPPPEPPAAAGAEPGVDISAYTSDGGAAELLSSPDEPSLRLYGFADFSVNQLFEDDLVPIFGENPAFAVGNLNLYVAADLTNRWRSLAEVRFTFLPNGALDPTTFQRISTQVNDPANLGSQIRWGGVSIERVWLEYSAHELFTIRAGQWLTPVGIWNVDHGTPTIIPAFRPFVISAGLFPARQTGFEIYGNRLFGETTIGYHLTLSNGRGAADSYKEFDKNKAVGGRLFVTFTPLGTLTLGGSMYGGRNTDASPVLVRGTLGSKVDLQYDEFGWAADLLWQWEGVHLQSEVFWQQVVYTEAGRQAPAIPMGGGLLPNHERKGGYVLLGYRLPWIPLMPFLEADYLNNGGGEAIQPNCGLSRYSTG